MFPFNQRINSIYGPQTYGPTAENLNTGNPAFDNFARLLVPLMKHKDFLERGEAKKERRFKASEAQREQEFEAERQGAQLQQQANLQRVANMAAATKDLNPMEPIGTRYVPQLTPYQEAQLGLKGEQLDLQKLLGLEKIGVQEKGIESREKIAEGGQKLIGEKQAETGRHNLINEELTRLGITNKETRDRILADIRREELGETATHHRATEASQAEANRIREILANKALTPEQRMQQIEATAAARAGMPSQQNAAVQARYNRLINEKPEWRDYVKFNPNTETVEVLEVGSGGGWFGGGKPLTEQMRKQILDYLYPGQSTTGTTTAPKPSATQETPPPRPKGVGANAKPRRTSRGWIWVE